MKKLLDSDWLRAASAWSNKTKQAIQLGYANHIIYFNLII